MEEFELLQMQSDQIKDELDVMFSTKEITEATYNKNITSLAYEFALHGFSEDCILMLLNIKGNYFMGDAATHMEEDESYFKKCVFIFEILSFLGYVPYDILATQKEGKA